MVAKKMQSFAHLAAEALELSFSSKQIGAQLLGPQHNMASLAHRGIAQECNPVGGNVAPQRAVEADMVVHEADDGAGDEPSSLHARQKKCVRLHELAFGREFLNESGNGRPKHPEARGDQRIHEVELPNLYPMSKRQN